MSTVSNEVSVSARIHAIAGIAGEQAPRVARILQRRLDTGHISVDQLQLSAIQKPGAESDDAANLRKLLGLSETRRATPNKTTRTRR